MLKLTDRQNLIYEVIRKKEKASVSLVLSEIKKIDINVSRWTVLRDIEKLLEHEIIIKKGEGRGVAYLVNKKNKYLEYISPKLYFKTNYYQRVPKFKNFNFEVFNNYEPIFNEKELFVLDKLNKKYQARLAKISSGIYKREVERLTIDLSWKSSRIEGNTYTIFETEQLLKYKEEPPGHSREEAVMILNHKETIDYSLNNKTIFRKINISKIEDFHQLIVSGLGIKKNLRERPVRITGTQYLPLDNKYQIREAMEKMIKLINSGIHPLEKALFCNMLVAYIQPFEDGNKRTSRLLANAILFAYGYCPLSFVNIEIQEYKKAMLLFYEQNSALYFKELFVEQYKFAVDNYFLA
ncbi:Fic family protein [Candidatus Parcubacteria bacterium]|nr:Fic family protein [Candidatus Parcubacteria bacterium]